MSGEVVILNHPIFSKKIFINFNKDILKPKSLNQLDSPSGQKSYRIPHRKFILKSRADKFGYRGGDGIEDPLKASEYVYKSARNDKAHIYGPVKTEPNLDEIEREPIRAERKKIHSLIQSMKKPSKADLLINFIPEKPATYRNGGHLSPKSMGNLDSYLLSPKSSVGQDSIFLSPRRRNL